MNEDYVALEPEELDRRVRENIQELYALIEANVTADKEDILSAMVDTVVSMYADTWEEAYGALAQVIAKYGSDASMEVGEIEEGKYSNLTPDHWEIEGEAECGCPTNKHGVPIHDSDCPEVKP